MTGKIFFVQGNIKHFCDKVQFDFWFNLNIKNLEPLASTIVFDIKYAIFPLNACHGPSITYRKIIADHTVVT